MNRWNQLPNPSVVTGAANVPIWEQLSLTLVPVLTNPYYLLQFYFPQQQVIISPSGRSYYDHESRRWKPIPNGGGDSWGNFWFGFILAMLFLAFLYWILRG